MARLLSADSAHKLKPSQAEAAGKAFAVLEKQGYLNVPKLADLLSLHKYTVKEYIDKGLIQSFVITNRHYVDIEEVERIRGLLEAHGSLANAYHATKQANTSQRSNEDDIA